MKTNRSWTRACSVILLVMLGVVLLPANREGVGKTMTDEDRRKALEAVAAQRWSEVDGGTVSYTTLPDEIDDKTDPITREFFEYYRMPRGRHPRSRAGSH